MSERTKKGTAAGGVEGQLEMTPAVFHILLALADSDLHGYAIMQRVEESTGGEIRLPPGTLYRSVAKMLDHELIDEVEGGPDDRRRVYTITERGRRRAAAEARRLAGVVDLARSRKLIETTEAPR